MQNHHQSILLLLLFAVPCIITLYFSFTFSYYLFILAAPLLLVTAVFAPTPWEDVSRKIGEFKREKEERLFNSLNKEEQDIYMGKHPNSSITIASINRKEHMIYLAYAKKTLSEATDPILINTYQATCVTHDEMHFMHEHTTIYCYKWVKKSGDKLDINEIEEILKLRAEKQ
jgi:hypothetical protein